VSELLCDPDSLWWGIDQSFVEGGYRFSVSPAPIWLCALLDPRRGAMTQLTTNLSDPLLELLQRDEVTVDGVEVGPWFSVQQVHRYRQMLPHMPFYLHGGDLIERVGWVPGTIRKIAAYLECTGSPWVSMHLTTWLPGMVWLMLRWGWRMPLSCPARAKRRLIRQAVKLSHSLSVPVLLENVEPLPFAGYECEVSAERIVEMLEGTGCDFVLDTGHARISAAALGIDAYRYLDRLPLYRVVQVHISGPREREGRLVDAHEPLQAVDYDLLEYALTRTDPQVVTLEYIRQPEALREQLARLRVLLDAG
jgi:uncharacterized protein (UPF0276 family)